MMDQSSGNNPGTTSKGLILYSSFIGADSQGSKSEDLGKVGIRSRWCKALMLTQGTPHLDNRCELQINDEGDSMRNACVQGMNFQLGLMHPKGVGELETMGFTHEETDLITEKFCGNHPGLSHEG